MNRLTTFILSLFLGISLYSSAQQLNVLDNKVYRVTAYKRGDTGITSRSNYAEVVPPLSIYIPNAFTPNGDGINDGFQVKGEGIRDFHIYIYNRWGEVIFESTNPKQAWDGTFQGRPVEMETYVYQVFADGLGKKSRTGSVTLIR